MMKINRNWASSFPLVHVQFAEERSPNVAIDFRGRWWYQLPDADCVCDAATHFFPFIDNPLLPSSDMKEILYSATTEPEQCVLTFPYESFSPTPVCPCQSQVTLHHYHRTTSQCTFSDAL